MGFVGAETVLSERLSIELQACDRARNRYRRWHVTAGQDLFGRRWHARVTFGRIGCNGRTIRHDFVSGDDAAAFIRACLRRRATAEKPHGPTLAPDRRQCGHKEKARRHRGEARQGSG
jgi:predicted DNA-binding WGR domain protein